MSQETNDHKRKRALALSHTLYYKLMSIFYIFWLNDDRCHCRKTHLIRLTPTSIWITLMKIIIFVYCFSICTDSAVGSWLPAQLSWPPCSSPSNRSTQKRYAFLKYFPSFSKTLCVLLVINQSTVGLAAPWRRQVDWSESLL